MLTGQHTGVTDIPLTETGEDEARGLGTHFQDIVFTHVLTSPLKRARHRAAKTPPNWPWENSATFSGAYGAGR